MAVAIVATTQDTYPPRVALAVTGLTVGNVVSVYRVVGGTATVIRDANSITVADTAISALDAELSFGVPLAYRVDVGGVTTAWSSSITVTLTNGKVALSDAITGLSAEVVIVAWSTMTRRRDATVYQVGSRYITVSSPMSQFTAEMTILVETLTALYSLRALLAGTTSGIVQIRQSGAYGDVDGYVTVLSATESRVSQDGSDPRRQIVLSIVENAAWASTFITFGWSYASLELAYDGLTYADLEADYATYLDLAVADLGV